MPAITVRGVTLLTPRDTAPTNFKILEMCIRDSIIGARHFVDDLFNRNGDGLGIIQCIPVSYTHLLSELDDARQTYLLTRIEDKQTFVTTCDSAAFARTNGKLVFCLLYTSRCV